MKAIDSRKAVRDLKKMLRAKGIDVDINTGRGRGSHKGVVFKNIETGETVTLVIPGHDELSPGVQRDMIAWARAGAQLVKNSETLVQLYEIVRDVFDSIFK